MLSFIRQNLQLKDENKMGKLSIFTDRKIAARNKGVRKQY